MLFRDAALAVVLAHVLALCLYAVASWLHVRQGTPDAATKGRIRLAAVLGVLVHGFGLGWAAIVSDRMPGFAESLSAVSFGIMAGYTWLGAGRLTSLGVWLAPAATLTLTLSMMAPAARVSASELPGGSLWLPLHIGLVFAAISGFFLEFVVGAAQVWVRRRLKRKRFGGLTRFPPLDVLDQTQVRALVFGLVCLTLGIIAGGIWASSAMHHSWLADPKVWFTLLIWVWYAISLQVRVVVGFHGRWSLTFSALGFLGLVFSIVGLDFVTGGFHAYVE